MHRLFVAVDLPEEVKGAVSDLTRGQTWARWIAPEQLHLTLRFIGEVDSVIFSAVRDALSVVRFSSFRLALCGAGHFPPGRNARVIWVGLSPCPELIELQQDIELALSATGIEPEQRPFSPHITLARLRQGAPAAVQRFESEHDAFTSPPFPVDRFVLYSSTLTPQGAIHTSEAQYRCR